MSTNTVYATKRDLPGKSGNPCTAKARQIRAALTIKGTSLGAWAEANGYERRTVYVTVERWAHRVDREPLGRLSREIMERLRRDLGSEVVPPVRTRIVAGHA